MVLKQGRKITKPFGKTDDERFEARCAYRELDDRIRLLMKRLVGYTRKEDCATSYKKKMSIAGSLWLILVLLDNTISI